MADDELDATNTPNPVKVSTLLDCFKQNSARHTILQDRHARALLQLTLNVKITLNVKKKH